MRKRFLSLLLLALPFVANAEKTQINKIWYKLFAETQTVEVTSPTDYSKYEGDITIPGKVTHNGVEYSVTSIGESAFMNSRTLTNISIPNGVTSIGRSAFSYCSSLTNVIIPNSIKSIGIDSFHGCHDSIKINIEDLNVLLNLENPFIVPIPGTDREQPIYFYFKSFRLFLKGKEVENLVIPNNITRIPSYAFHGCMSLKSVTIPNCVTSIGNRVFTNCKGLTSITIPNCVTTISEEAFLGCQNLISVNIPNSVTSIEKDAFKDCFSLTPITIPNSVTSIGESAFYHCI